MRCAVSLLHAMSHLTLIHSAMYSAHRCVACGRLSLHATITFQLSSRVNGTLNLDLQIICTTGSALECASVYYFLNCFSAVLLLSFVSVFPLYIFNLLELQASCMLTCNFFQWHQRISSHQNTIQALAHRNRGEISPSQIRDWTTKAKSENSSQITLGILLLDGRPPSRRRIPSCSGSFRCSSLRCGLILFIDRVVTLELRCVRAHESTA